MPISSLPNDFYIHEEKQHRLIGRRRGRAFRLGDAVTVRLAEANPVTGGLILTVIEPDGEGEAPRQGRPLTRPKQRHGGGPPRGRQARRR